MVFFFHERSSAISYNVTLSLSSDILNPLPIDCKLRILLLLGDANTILCSLFMLIPVEKVPNDATIMALFSFSTISLTFSLSNASVPPNTKNTFLLLFSLANKPRALYSID